jgi:intracellular sulfur oxidation DsrE/DsrF family protein
MAALAAATGLAPLLPGRASAAGHAAAAASAVDPALEAWFGRIKGKHRQVFDASEPNSGMGAIWPRVYINTMNATYPNEGTTAVVILRHGGLPLSMQDSLWAKYKLGEMFNIQDGTTPATRNVYAKIEGLPIPGLGIAELMREGVLVGVCDVALTVYSSGAATKMGMNAADVKKEWVAGLLPGVQIVPSGVMAVSRAQELGCTYCFAG